MPWMIEVADLTRRFGSFCAVDNITFGVEAGQIFAFLGPNGAGKTTTIKMLTTILRPTSGTMLVNGFDPTRQSREVRKSIGIGFQDPSVDDNLTAFENMDFHGALYGVPRKLRRQRTEKLLQIVELWDRRRDLVKQFSGGMKRRLEIARALLHQPRIIFLDEPTIGLDPQTRNRIWGLIKQLSREETVTVLFTTHYMEEADRVADRIAVIDHGRIVANDTPAALKQAAGAANLEDAFIALTGNAIRGEEASSSDRLRVARKMWSRR
jgi:ABC-2 type transport system ATP-binding protein